MPPTARAHNGLPLAGAESSASGCNGPAGFAGTTGAGFAAIVPLAALPDPADGVGVAALSLFDLPQFSRHNTEPAITVRRSCMLDDDTVSEQHQLQTDGFFDDK
jgi:hypothetical protein